jgi:hypothetical protein
MSSQALCAKLGIPAGIPCGTHADLVRSLWLPSRACGSRHVPGVSSQEGLNQDSLNDSGDSESRHIDEL